MISARFENLEHSIKTQLQQSTSEKAGRNSAGTYRLPAGLEVQEDFIKFD